MSGGVKYKYCRRTDDLVVTLSFLSLLWRSQPLIRLSYVNHITSKLTSKFDKLGKSGGNELVVLAFAQGAPFT